MSAVVDQLVVCSLEPWDETWRRNQFLVRELQALLPELKVLFVEPPFDVIHEARRGNAPRRGRMRQPAGPNLLALRPHKLLPRVTGRVADRWVERQVVAAAAEFGLSEPVLWINDSRYARLPRATGWPAVYDVTDDWTLAVASRRDRRRRRREDELLVATADAVVVCSRALASSRGGTRPPRLIPNAVDVAHFTRQQARPADLPRGPVVVYVGTLHDERIDVDLVTSVANALPQVKVTLVGPDVLTPASRARLRSAGVELLGPRPYATVPGYLQHADVVIVPHVISPFTETLDPIKAYEVRAVGRPAVATPVAGFRGLGAPVRVADRSRFVAEVTAALSSRAPVAIAASPPGWDARASEFAAVLAEVRSLRHSKSLSP